jgi:hypothetical protein
VTVGKTTHTSAAGLQALVYETMIVFVVMKRTWKTCPKCSTAKELTSYTKNTTKKDGLNSICKSCQNAYTRDHYSKNKAYYKSKSKQHRDRLRTITDRLKDVPCMDCGVKYPPYVMDFDHRDPKDKSFTVASAQSQSLVSSDRLEEEIAKCDVVCSNCHRERTHGNNL